MSLAVAMATIERDAIVEQERRQHDGLGMPASNSGYGYSIEVLPGPDSSEYVRNLVTFVAKAARGTARRVKSFFAAILPVDNGCE